MGNCSCIQGINEENQVDTEKIYPRPLHSPETLKFPKKSKNTDIQLQISNKEIINLQSLLRGYAERKSIKGAYSFLSSTPNENFKIKPSSNDCKIFRSEVTELPLERIPDYWTSTTNTIRIKLGDFIYGNSETIENTIKRGPVEIENGAIYTGDWNSDNQRYGKGLQIWKDGSVYEGFWLNDKANGRGRLIHANGDVYEGEWCNDKAQGKGIYIHNDGAKYEGDWKDDKQHGKGVEIWQDGAKYEGNYENGHKHGFGKFEWADGSVYKGELKENNIHGVGVYEWSDGRRYEGQWKNNKMDGKGLFTWSDGRSYNGEYLNDKKHGFGIFLWPDGRKYEGNWARGKQDGRGVYITALGSREGEWKEGKRIKDL